MNEMNENQNLDIVELDSLLETEEELVALDSSSCRASGH